MSNKTKSILKTSASSLRKTKKSRVKIATENNIELVFHKPFSIVDKPHLWHGKTERQSALQESLLEEINEIGKNKYLEKHNNRIAKRKSHSIKMLTEYKTRKNIPYLAANLANVKKINANGDDNGIITLKRSSRYGGKSRKYRK